MRVCDALAEHGFIEVQNLEVLQIEDIVRTRNVPVMELEFLKTKVCTCFLRIPGGYRFNFRQH